MLHAESTAPSVFPLLSCCGSQTSGTHITVACLASGYLPQPVDVKWNSGSITSGITNFPAVFKNGLFTSSSQLEIPVSDWEKGTFQCNVEHSATSSRINKEIPHCSASKGSPPTVQVLQAPCDDKTDKSSIELVCLIYGYAPSDIKVQWMLNGKATSISPTNSTPVKNAEGTYESRSKVFVPREDWNSGDVYTCKVVHDATDSHPEVNIHKCQETSGVHPKIALYPPSPKDLLITKEGKVTCEVSRLDSSEEIPITWSRSDNKRVLQFTSDAVQQYDGTYTIKSFLKISPGDWKKGLECTCTVIHSALPTPIKKSIKKIEGAIKEPTLYLYAPPQEEINNHDFVSLICLMKSFNPEDMYVQWKKEGVLQTEDYYFNTKPVMEEEEDYFMFSKLTIAKSDWNRGATYTCVAVHDQITEKDIKKSREYIDCEGSIGDDDDSLWTTAATFVTLFLMSIFYSATITLVKVKWFISRILQFEMHEDNHFITVLDTATQ